MRKLQVFEIGNPKFDETSRYIATAMAYLTYGLIPQKWIVLLFNMKTQFPVGVQWSMIPGKSYWKEKSWTGNNFIKSIKWCMIFTGLVMDRCWFIRWIACQIFNSSILYNIAEHCPTQPENNEVLNHIHQVYLIVLCRCSIVLNKGHRTHSMLPIK